MSTHQDAHPDDDGVPKIGDRNPLGDALSRADRFRITLDEIEGGASGEEDSDYVAAMRAYLARRQHSGWRRGRPNVAPSEPPSPGPASPPSPPIPPDAIFGPPETTRGSAGSPPLPLTPSEPPLRPVESIETPMVSAGRVEAMLRPFETPGPAPGAPVGQPFTPLDAPRGPMGAMAPPAAPPGALLPPPQRPAPPDMGRTWRVNLGIGIGTVDDVDTLGTGSGEDLDGRDRHAADRAAPHRTGWARPADRRLLDVLAVTAAAGAFVAPSAWLIGTAAACATGGVFAFAAAGHPLHTLPGRAVHRTMTLLHPRSLMWAPVLAARTVIAAVVLPAAVAALIWTLDEGTTGVVAAARAGAWSYGFRVAVAIVCVMLVSSVGEGRHRRAAALRRWVSGVGDAALVLVVAAGLAVTALVVVAVPHPTDALAARADGLAWVPTVARVRADRMRDDMVTAQLSVLAECLVGQGGTAWHTSYSVGNPLGETDVARLVAGGETLVPPPDLATAILAAHNQLAPWVETIEVSWADAELVSIDRDPLPRHRPITEATTLLPATTIGSQWLATATADQTVVLHCSAGPVL